MSIGWKEKRILVKTAQLYYLENKTQQEISELLGVSRPSVSRWLKDAREQGVVEIDVKLNYSDTYITLENDIEKKYDLKGVIIVPYYKERFTHLMAEAAAEVLTRTVRSGDIIGVSWGTTLSYIPCYITNVNVHDITFVPLIGGGGQTRLNVHSNQIIIDLSKVFDSNWQLLHAPAVVDKVEIKKNLLSDKNIRYVLNLAEKSTIALVGIGNPLSHTSTLSKSKYLSEKDFKELKRVGAIGDICWQFIDENGDLCPTSINHRIVGVRLEKLKDISVVIAVAGGEEKHASILASLKGGYIDILVTDSKTGQYLVEN